MFGFYVVKITSIFIVSIMYVLCGMVLSIFLEFIMSKKDPKYKSFIILLIEIAFIFGLIAILYYFIRIFIKRIPFIFDGMYGFKYSLLQETSGGIIIAYILFVNQTKLRNILNEIQTRIIKSLHINTNYV